eukprot:2234948-Prymnesium_polylepis.2
MSRCAQLQLAVQQRQQLQDDAWQQQPKKLGVCGAPVARFDRTTAERVPVGSQSQFTQRPKQHTRAMARYVPLIADGCGSHRAMITSTMKSKMCEARAKWRNSFPFLSFGWTTVVLVGSAGSYRWLRAGSVEPLRERRGVVVASTPTTLPACRHCARHMLMSSARQASSNEKSWSAGPRKPKSCISSMQP